MPICKICKQDKSEDLFETYFDKRAGKCHQRRRVICKACKVDTNKDRCKESYNQLVYRLDLIQTKQFFDAHNNRCDICNSIHNLRIDHCHETGQLRGLLCNKCNLGLGLFKDSTELLELALGYLTKYKNMPVDLIRMIDVTCHGRK